MNNIDEESMERTRECTDRCARCSHLKDYLNYYECDIHGQIDTKEQTCKDYDDDRSCIRCAYAVFYQSKDDKYPMMKCMKEHTKIPEHCDDFIRKTFWQCSQCRTKLCTHIIRDGTLPTRMDCKNHYKKCLWVQCWRCPRTDLERIQDELIAKENGLI